MFCFMSGAACRVPRMAEYSLSETNPFKSSTGAGAGAGDSRNKRLKVRFLNMISLSLSDKLFIYTYILI